MKVEFDPPKNARNISERGLSFDQVMDLDWSTALVDEDIRRDYGEKRYVAYVLLDKRLHVVCFSEPIGGVVRVISFRKANDRERRKYEKAKATDE